MNEKRGGAESGAARTQLWPKPNLGLNFKPISINQK